jgi:demethylmenaquinone methyltransferase/2-methoxy-6-polyprenyl-1,4-benzoquinol methylase
MTHLTGKERAHYVQSMFARIAGRYDLMNRLMTAGQDGRWRDDVLRLADPHPGDRLLDLGSGTGDLALAAARQSPNTSVVAADFTLEMMKVGQQRPGGNAIPWSAADATQLPFASASFDAVISGFLMRNVADLPGALAEQHRVLKPGGRVVILDTTRPPRNLLSPFIRIHLHVIIPALGKLIAGDSSAYTYLPDSTEGFLAAETLAERLGAAGFQNVRFFRRMFGTIAIHFGVKER